MFKSKKATALIMVLALMLSLCSVGAIAADDTGSNAIYIPLWMQPDTVIIYDTDLNYTIVQGGELAEADLIGRDDIASIGLTTTDSGFLAEPNTRVEYDLHGFHKNTYYLSTAASDEYQLSNPRRLMAGTGTLANGATTGDYGKYRNYDTQADQYNRLTRSGSTITGTGRITYYYGKTGDHSNTLTKYDCATKMYDCDVSSGTTVTAKNTYASKSTTFYKQDCGGLPSAILDIWCGTSSSDTSNQAIKDLTSGGGLDNVYSGSISLSV